MKKKSIITLLLSTLMTASVATGIAITAGANGSEKTKEPLAQNTQTTVSKGNAAYTVGKEDSVAVYGQDNNSPVMGIKATLAPDDALTFHNVIDLNEMYEKGESFLDLLPIVEEEGVAEYKGMFIEVVDAYDPTNFLKIKINCMPQMEDSSTTSYFLAGASNGQKLTGYEVGSGKLHVNNEYGEYSVFAFGDVIQQYSGAGFFYDVIKNTISVVDYRGVKKQIIDLDDPAYFGTNIWSGFTTGEVYCRIKCDDYKKDAASFLVTKYGNYDLTNPEICDEVAPVIKVDYGAYTKDPVPSALLNHAYPIFPVTTTDALDGVLETEVKVYMNYHSSNPMSVNVKNGMFTPKMPVPYTIVYSATDAHGNESREVLQINVINSIGDIVIDFAEFVETTVEGDLYALPAYTVNNAMGCANVTVDVTLNGKALEIEKDAVRPFVEGEMKVFYKVVDYIGRNCETSFSVNVEAATKPTFIETPILPNAFIAGNSYVLPKLDAYNYVTAQGDAISTEIYVKEGSDVKLLVDGEYVPSNVAETEIIYKAKIGDAVNEYSVSIPVYNVRTEEGLNMAKYFLGGANTSVSAQFNGVDLTATADAKFDYINYLAAISLDTEFSLGQQPKNAEKVHVYLTDISNPSRMLKFTYVLTGTQAYFYVNDDEAGAVPVEGDIEAEKRFFLNFVADEKKVYYDIVNRNILPVSTFLNGEAFEGFTKNRAYVSYAFEGVKDSATISVNAINGNYFSDEVDDWISPLIDLVGNVGGEYLINSVVSLPEIVATDVMEGDVKGYITVTSPSGKVLTTVDGKKLEKLYYDGSNLQVKLEEYGCYSVEITAEDTAGNSAFIPTVLWVVDTENPSFTLSKEVATTAKVGAKITLPTVKATDNLSEKVQVTVYVMVPGGKMLDVSNSKGFVAKVAGVYTVVYYVTDDAGNFASEYYTIKVS